MLHTRRQSTDRAAARPWRRLPVAPLLTALALVILAALALGACSSGEADFECEGTRSGPEDLGTAPLSHDGEICPDGSYYLVREHDTEEALPSLTVTVSELDEDVDLFVHRGSFNDADIDCVSANSGTSTESCTADDMVGDVYIHLKLVSEDQNGTEFDLSVTVNN